jgi:hypothetical protein
MKNNYIDNKSRKNAILFEIITTSSINAGIFLINPVNSLVAASVNLDANSIIEINKPQDQLPQLNGSINVFEKSNDVIRNNINVSLADTANIAKDQFSDNKNITVIAGHLDVKQGSLVYRFTG